jgi:hypothetical protein
LNILIVEVRMSERTYLRVRRRRNAVAVLKIQLDGILEPDDEHDDSPSPENRPAVPNLPPDVYSHRRPSKRSKKVVWRRVSETENNDFVLYSEALQEVNRKRDYRVVDAILHDDDNNDDHLSSHKRRRLTLVQSSFDHHNASSRRRLSWNEEAGNDPVVTKRTSRQPYKILLPNERAIDDSLKQVFVGKRLVSEHYDLCCTDPRFAEHRDRWLAHRNEDYGNVLHACALWNDVGVASDLALNHHQRVGHDGFLESLVRARDGEGRTPLQVAELSGHDGVVGVLRGVHDDSDDESFVFDLYCLDGDGSNETDNAENKESNVDDFETTPLDCELEGGVGYWDENGQLVLDLLPPRTASEVSVADEEEYDDPNHEDWNGNDYPDEEDVDEDPLSDDEPIEAMENRGRAGFTCGHESDDEGDFDAAYGIYGQEDDAAYGAYAFEEGSTGSTY